MARTNEDVSVRSGFMISDIFSLLGSKRKYAVSFLAGSASVLALPPFSFWPVLFLTLPVLFLLLSASNREAGQVLNKKAFSWQVYRRFIFRTGYIGWFFGFGYFVAGLYWMGQAFLVEADKFAILLPLAVLAMPAFLALFYALAVVPVFIFRHSPLASVFGMVAGLGGAEWLKSNVLTGFPWNSIGYGLLSEPGLSQGASLIGVYGFNFLTVFVCLSPVVFLVSLQDKEKIAGYSYFAVAALVFISCLLWGYGRLEAPSAGYVDGVKFRIVQPNIPQKRKTNPSYHPWIFSELLKYSKGPSSSSNFEGISHVIWPEMAVPALLARDKEKQKGISDLLPEGVHLISGSFRLEQEQYRNRVYNSLFVMDHNAGVIASYDKKHLVPFGEYLPFQNFLEALGLEALTRQRGGFAVGRGERSISVAGLPLFNPLICYEIIFPNAVIEDGNRPGWLLNITNDAWFGYSTGPYQHLHQAQIRAIEEGLPVIRVANTGVSAIIDGKGRILKSMPLETGGYFDHGLPKGLPVTLYSQWRSFVFPSFLLIFFLFSLVFLYAFRRKCP